MQENQCDIINAREYNNMQYNKWKRLNAIEKMQHNKCKKINARDNNAIHDKCKRINAR